jgi:2-oxo-4-hydroxy-4-carboxy--5-ureidoimidazoline (OHCU) decarboxylase
MLSALRERLDHDAADELPIAAAEQSKITVLRLKKLLTSG